MRATFDSNCLVDLELTQAASSDLRELIRLVIGARSRSVFQEYMVRQFRLRRTVGRRYISDDCFDGPVDGTKTLSEHRGLALSNAHWQMMAPD